jgi:hypothetical protein
MYTIDARQFATLTFDGGISLDGAVLVGPYCGAVDTRGRVEITCVRQGFGFHSGDTVEFAFREPNSPSELVVSDAKCIKAETVRGRVLIELRGNGLIRREVMD